MKSSATIGAFIVLVLVVIGGYLLFTREAGEVATPNTLQDTSHFEGTLEEVNTGCYADGECYVVVGGKHITTLMGWSRETVGTADYDALTAAIGATVEVYAHEKEDGTYTLYGDASYYVRVK